jgi:hypothetical protein
MGFLSRLFGGKPKEEVNSADEHLVQVRIPLHGGEMGDSEEFEDFTAIEDLLGEKADRAGVGYLDGNEVGGNEFTIWLYGPQAMPLAEVVRNALSDQKLPAGTTIYLRYGGMDDEDAREEVWPVT